MADLRYTLQVFADGTKRFVEDVPGPCPECQRLRAQLANAEQHRDELRERGEQLEERLASAQARIEKAREALR